VCVCVRVCVCVCVYRGGEREDVSTLQTCCTHQIYVRVNVCVVCLCVCVCVYVTGLMSCKPQRSPHPEDKEQKGKKKTKPQTVCMHARIHTWIC
jgi:hypothetical protein